MLPAAMVPDNGLEFIGLVLALITSWFCVLGTGKRIRPADHFWKIPRFQAYSWLLGSGLSTILLNWKGFGFFQTLDQAHFIFLYAIWATVGILTAHVFIFTIIFFEALFLSGSQRIRRAVFSLMVLFVRDGWEAYQNEKTRMENEDISILQKAEADAALIVAGLSIDTLTRLPVSDDSGKEDLADKVLRGMQKELLRLSARDDIVFNLNYLIAIPWSKARQDQGICKDIRFDFEIDGVEKDKRYTHLLVLKRRLSVALGPPIVFGMPDHSRPPTSQTLLPGAPQAIASGNYVFLSKAVNGKFDLTFGAAVPDGPEKERKIRTDVTQFFNDLGCESLLCIPLVRGQDTVGVVNIESSSKNLVGKGRSRVNEVATSLVPFCTILSHIVGEQI